MQNENLEAAKHEVNRKSLDQREQMNELMRLRHSCAHMLATAVLRLWPDALLDIGPPTDEGYYYDFELRSHRFTPEDFPKIEEEMRKVVKENQVFEKSIKTREEALAYFESKGQKFKVERLGDIPEGEAISFYQNGEFVDLCAGPHVMRTGNVKAFKLLSVASAYFRGNEKNPQLQRLYGTAFKNKEELENWVKLQEEAKRRDHRKIGQEMGLFAFDSEYVGPGLPLWLPKGTVLVEELEKLAKEEEFKAGYVRVRTPHLAREKMYKTSGHLPYYADSMFPPMELLEEQELKRKQDLIVKRAHAEDQKKAAEASQADAGTIEKLSAEIAELQQEIELLGGRYYLKAMNCPHHHRIFAAEPRSYRDLPLRLAEYGTCYRYEQSGELFGLMRVRSMQMNDAHMYCTPEQFAAEFRAVNEMYLKYFKIFGLGRYVMRFSTHDPARLGQKFVNEPELWKQTEDMVRQVLVDSGINFIEVPNEAAFYGPKIDVQVWSIIGREFTIATNQVDFAVPKRFGLTYRDRDNTDKTPLVIHRAPLGTHERFIGFLIEHYAGNFPLWLAPEQVRVLTVGNEPPLVEYASAIAAELRAKMVRVETDFGSDKINGKIQQAETEKVHTMLVIGQREMEGGNVALRVHGKGNQGVKPKAEVIANLLEAIQERRA
ncbi:MAG TPA: threonine--tRNA ligase [Candidatus Limnocylindria bacterium]|nr:threonine--tRNA ligase [Candidatus Limnocylindria bacterium]